MSVPSVDDITRAICCPHGCVMASPAQCSVVRRDGLPVTPHVAAARVVDYLTRREAEGVDTE